MKPIMWIAPSLLAVASLGGTLVQQHRISGLQEQLAALQDRAASPSQAAADLTEIKARIVRIEQTQAWQASAGTPAAAPAAPGAPPAAPAAPEVARLREDVDALLTGEAASTEQGKARLRTLIAETQMQQMAERQVRRDERILSQLVEVARITPRQREDLAKALEAERTQRTSLFTARGGQPGGFAAGPGGGLGGGPGGGIGGPGDVRPALQALRAQTDEKARAILDAEQYKQYTAARAPGRGGPRGGGGGGGNPAAGGPAD